MGANSVNLLELVSTGIAVASAIVAAISACSAIKVQERLVSIEAERDSREQRAALQAFFVLGRFWRQNDVLILFLENIGNGVAHNPRFTVDGMVFYRYPTFRKYSLKVWDVPPLAPGTTTEFKFDFKDHLLKPESFGVLWLDKVGVQHFQHLPIVRESRSQS